MKKEIFRYQYAVLSSSGEEGKRYTFECRYPNPLGAATCAAEHYESLQDSDGAAWPLVFVVYHLDGVEFCRYQIKRWLVPHFLATAGIGSEVPQ